MSVFMPTIDGPGLSARPPVSKVIPLPTSTTRPPALPPGVQSTRTRHGGCCEAAPTASSPPARRWARSSSSSTDTVRVPAVVVAAAASSRACPATQAGLFTEDGVAARSRTRQVARAATAAASSAAGAAAGSAPQQVDSGDGGPRALLHPGARG